MVKAKEFVEFLCNELNYKFFVGDSVPGLLGIHCALPDVESLHYIPAVNTESAMGLATGAVLAGVKTIVIIDIEELEVLNLKYRSLPFLFITKAEKVNRTDLLKSTILLKSVKSLIKKIDQQKRAGVIYIKEGQLDE